MGIGRRALDQARRLFQKICDGCDTEAGRPTETSQQKPGRRAVAGGSHDKDAWHSKGVQKLYACYEGVSERQHLQENTFCDLDPCKIYLTREANGPLLYVHVLDCKGSLTILQTSW